MTSYFYIRALKRSRSQKFWVGGLFVCFDLLTSRLATTQVIGRPRGAILILPCIMRCATILVLFLMQGFFNVQESKGDLTRDHYLNSPPIELSLKEFSHTRKISWWSDRDPSPRVRAQRQARSPLSLPITLRMPKTVDRVRLSFCLHCMDRPSRRWHSMV